MKNIQKKVRSKKLSSQVDLTAMVSVSFLLIIFFMLVGELSKPKAMYLDKGDNGCCDCSFPYEEENRSLTIMLGENNRLITYIGILANPIKAPKAVTYGKNGIRKEIITYNNAVLDVSRKNGKLGKGITVIIKPTKKSNYGNLIDILDEMKIAGITSYSVVPEFTPEESKLIASN